jgi:hypothetical protein
MGRKALASNSLRPVDNNARAGNVAQREPFLYNPLATGCGHGSKTQEFTRATHKRN